MFFFPPAAVDLDAKTSPAGRRSFLLALPRHHRL